MQRMLLYLKRFSLHAVGVIKILVTYIFEMCFDVILMELLKVYSVL